MILAIIQARYDSKRLPGKVLMDLGGKTVLQRVVDAVRECKSVDAVTVATTYQGGGGAIGGHCDTIGVSCYMHDQPLMANGRNDVLGRFVACSVLYRDVSHVLRVCGDSPLLDSQAADALIAAAIESKADYVGYQIDGQPAVTLPTGYFAEVATFDALLKAHKLLDANDPRREHVTACLYEEGGGYSCHWLKPPKWYAKEPLKLAAIDTAEDLERVREAIG